MYKRNENVEKIRKGVEMKAQIAVGIVGMMALAGFAGCLEQIIPGSGKEQHEDYSKKYEDWVASPQYTKSYTFPVDEGAEKAIIGCKLEMAAGGAPFPPFAYVTFTVKDPSGANVTGATLTLDPSKAEGTITISSFKSYGSYKLEITGYGLSGGGYGAKYTVSIDVKYAQV